MVFEAFTQRKPIGKIEYFATNGQIKETAEYTNAEQFEKDIRKESHFGVPIGICIYKNSEGQTIPYDFIYQLDPPPLRFKILVVK